VTFNDVYDASDTRFCPLLLTRTPSSLLLTSRVTDTLRQFDGICRNSVVIFAVTGMPPHGDSHTSQTSPRGERRRCTYERTRNSVTD
jgi:hypothetical protein